MISLDPAIAAIGAFGIDAAPNPRRRSQARLIFLAADRFVSATGLVTLPPWLTVSCATTDRTSQQSASTLKAGYGANAARARNVGAGVGLSVECASTNGSWRSNALELWNVQGGVVVNSDAVNGPDGALLADELDLSGAADGSGAYVASDVRAVLKTMSIWGMQSGGACTMSMTNPQTGVPDVDIVLGAGWARFEAGAPANINTGVWLRRKPSGTNKGYFCYAQSEALGYPSSAYPAGIATDAVRDADVLSATATDLAPGGYFDIAFTIAPNYASTETLADHDFFFLAGTDRLYFKQSDRKVYFHFGGAADISSTALTFAREAPLVVRASYLATGRRLRIADAATGAPLYDSGRQAPGSAISLPATAYLLGNASGAQECADLKSMVVFAS